MDENYNLVSIASYLFLTPLAPKAVSVSHVSQLIQLMPWFWNILDITKGLQKCYPYLTGEAESPVRAIKTSFSLVLSSFVIPGNVADWLNSLEILRSGPPAISKRKVHVSMIYTFVRTGVLHNQPSFVKTFILNEPPHMSIPSPAHGVAQSVSPRIVSSGGGEAEQKHSLPFSTPAKTNPLLWQCSVQMAGVLAGRTVRSVMWLAVVSTHCPCQGRKSLLNTRINADGCKAAIYSWVSSTFELSNRICK